MRVVRDPTGCARVLGLMFLAGGLAVASLLLGAGTGSVPTGWGRVGAWLIASAHIGVGGWYTFVAAGVRAHLDSSERVLTITRSRPFYRRRRRIHVTDILDVLTRRGTDSDGDATFLLELRLRTGEVVPLHSSALNDEGEIREAKERLRAWSGGTLTFRETGVPLRGV